MGNPPENEPPVDDGKQDGDQNLTDEQRSAVKGIFKEAMTEWFAEQEQAPKRARRPSNNPFAQIFNYGK